MGLQAPRARLRRHCRSPRTVPASTPGGRDDALQGK